MTQNEVRALTFFPFLRKCLASEKIEVFPLAGDASNRRYYRAVRDEESFVLMVWEPFQDDGNYPFLSVLRHFLESLVQVPRVIGISESEGFVLLEDLGDLTLERKFWENQDQQLALPFYKLAIDELIKIHYVATKNKKKCTAFNIQFDVEKLLWEMNYARTHLFEQFCGLALSSKQSESLQKVFLSICEKLHNEPKYICHRDYHSRNLMIKFGKMRVIDFQDARLGPIQYDLVSLLKDSYVALDEASRLRLLEYYLDQRADYEKSPISAEHFQRIYELQTIQRCLKACGSFSSFYNSRKDLRYLKYISGTLKHVVAGLERFDEYRFLKDLIVEEGLLEKNYELTGS